MAQDFWSVPWYKKIVMLLLWPAMVAATIFGLAVVLVPLLCYVLVVGSVSAIRFRFRMARCGRFLRLRDLRSRIAAEGGTLILDSRAMGSGPNRVWWTLDDVLASSPHTEPDYRALFSTRASSDGPPKPQWDQWCWDHYTRPEDGRALYVSVWKVRKLESRLKQDFPNLKVIHTMSAFVNLPAPRRQHE